MANGGGSPGRVFGAVGSLLHVSAVNAFVRQRLRPILPAAPAGPTREDLLAVTALIEAGTLTPVVDRNYPLADAAEGVRPVERGHARGKAVVTVARARSPVSRRPPGRVRAPPVPGRQRPEIRRRQCPAVTARQGRRPARRVRRAGEAGGPGRAPRRR
ncbi:hypothetical protein GCM10027162_73560 [Streptomyces incanus]